MASREAVLEERCRTLLEIAKHLRTRNRALERDLRRHRRLTTDPEQLSETVMAELRRVVAHERVPSGR